MATVENVRKQTASRPDSGVAARLGAVAVVSGCCSRAGIAPGQTTRKPLPHTRSQHATVGAAVPAPSHHTDSRSACCGGRSARLTPLPGTRH